MAMTIPQAQPTDLLLLALVISARAAALCYSSRHSPAHHIFQTLRRPYVPASPSSHHSGVQGIKDTWKETAVCYINGGGGEFRYTKSDYTDSEATVEICSYHPGSVKWRPPPW